MEPSNPPKDNIVYADFLSDAIFFPEIVYEPQFQESLNLVPQPDTNSDSKSDTKKPADCTPNNVIPYEIDEFLAMMEEPFMKFCLDFADFDSTWESVIGKEDQMRAEAIVAELNIDLPTERVYETPSDQVLDPLLHPLLEPLPEPLLEPLIMPLPTPMSEPPIEPPMAPPLDPSVSMVVPHWPETTVMTLEELKVSPGYDAHDFSLR